MNRIAVVTGASAGVGRATAVEFAKQGCDVALLARNAQRLEAAARECRAFGVRALALPADVADAAAVEAAAARAEQELGPFDIWVNVAMATVFAPVLKLTAAEIRRATEVTYLGQVHGTLAALRRMRTRNLGTIINVGSALAYRAVPLQSLYCGAKFAIRGFTDSLRSEILHDGLKVHLCMVDLPAMNTPQFDWARNKTGRKAMPVPPVFQPEVGARAIYFAATHRRRNVWVGMPTVKAILADRIAPGLLDRYLAKAGYTGQLTDEPLPEDEPGNLFDSVDGPYGAHGRFDAQARPVSWELITDRHRSALWTAAGVGLLAGLLLLAGRARSGARRRKRPWASL
ncbi:MAG TPA: SDR family oxidoreductase [Steroidobacteraceae bacterium]|nr:SDR family oxidoreductase [Steroidobacteraceae bacterium]